MRLVSSCELINIAHLLQDLLPSRSCYARRLHRSTPFGREGAPPSPFDWCNGQCGDNREVARFCVSPSKPSVASRARLRHLSTADKCHGSTEELVRNAVADALPSTAVLRVVRSTCGRSRSSGQQGHCQCCMYVSECAAAEPPGDLRSYERLHTSRFSWHY